MTLVVPQKHYVYAVVDIAQTPPALVEIVYSRQEGREKVKVSDVPTLRVKRARLTILER